jgi:phage N-6-adenine-methyltransferase
MDHGEWLPWLAANEAELGFKERAARLLMKGAETNRQLATDLEVPEALQLSRTLWGHDKIRGTQGTGENEWFTPAEYIELARTVLGDIDLDPASSDEAQRIVQAAQYFTREDDGLEHEWHGRVWLNPPYAQPYIANFASKMVAELRAGRVDAAIMLTHNYTDTAWFHELVSEAAAICFTRGRVKFYSGDEIAAPTQGQAFFYFGGDAQLFAERFKSIGFVMVPA